MDLSLLSLVQVAILVHWVYTCIQVFLAHLIAAAIIYLNVY